MLQVKKYGLYILTSMCLITIMVCDLRLCYYTNLDLVFGCFTFFDCWVACIFTFF